MAARPSSRSFEHTPREHEHPGRRAAQGTAAQRVAQPSGCVGACREPGARRSGHSRQSSICELLEKLSPARPGLAQAGRSSVIAGDGGVATTAGAQQRPRGGRWKENHCPEGTTGGIPAFRPTSPSPAPAQCTSPLGSGSEGSPGKAALQAVRSLRRQATAAQAPPAAAMRQPLAAAPPRCQQQPQAPQGTPGFSESSTVGRAIDAQISSRIADLFMPTPEPGHEAHGADASGAPPAAAAVAAPTPAAAHELPGSAQNREGNSWQAHVAQQHAGAGLAAAPPPPTAARAATAKPGPLHMQSVLSPVFMSRKQRTLACELDEPASTTAFHTRARRRTGLQRLVASMFGCFVPPPGSRSPVPSMGALGSGRSTREGASTLRMDPLRQSLQGLAGHGGDPGGSRGAAATSGPLAAPPQAGLLGPWSQQQQRGQAEAQWQQERQRESYEGEGAAMNMASPVLPLQQGSRAGSPLHAHGGGGGIGEGPLVAAKRNLMHVLQSREARPAWKPAGVTVRQPLPPPRQARAASERAQPPAPVARATHVTLVQLLSGGSGARAGSGQHAGRQPSAGAKRGRESAAGSTATSEDGPSLSPKRRDLSKPSYRSQALHLLLSPPRGRPSQRANMAAGGGRGHLRRSLSASASPLRAPAAHAGPAAASAAGWGRAVVGSAPSSPPLAVPRLTRAATVRAAASQRRLAELRAQGTAFMARSPDRWLRAAAAEGLSLREAAVLASPGKTARPHCSRLSPPPRGSVPAWQPCGAPGGGVPIAPSPCFARFDSFEAGVEPYSARTLTADKPRQGGGRAPAAAARAAALPSSAAGQPARQPAPRSALGGGGGVDFARLVADRDAYLLMLHMLAQGLKGEPREMDSARLPGPPPLPEGAVVEDEERAGAQQAGKRPRAAGAADGADTVRPRAASVEALGRGDRAASPPTAVYSLQSASGHASPGAADEARSPRGSPPPHRNALYGRDATPTESSPVALQRMVSMSAAAAAQEQAGQPGRKAGEQASQAGSASHAAEAPARSDSHSISFGSTGCQGPTQPHAQDCGSASRRPQAQRERDERAGGERRRSSPGLGLHGEMSSRLAELATLLERQAWAGQRYDLRQLQAAGYSSHDLAALKAWLARQA